MSRTDNIYAGVPLAEYLSWPEWGASDLRAMRAGPPAIVPWRRQHPLEATEDIRVGAAAHCAILQPQFYAGLYAEKPEGMTFASREGKAWRDDPVRAGITILTHDEAETVRQIVAAFRGKALASDALARAVGIESSASWICPESGLHSKSRMDWYTADAIYDLKISRHAAGPSLSYRAYTEGWMHQLAHYRSGLRLLGRPEIALGRLVVIAPKPPQEFRVWCLEVKADALDLMELENVATRKRIAECERSGLWPSTPDEWTMIEPPASALDMAALVGAVEQD